jgi:uncharacterized membrane protein
MVSKKSTALKSIMWRVLGVVIKFLVTYFFVAFFNYPKPGITSLAITITHHAFFLLVFYLHDRLWLLVKKDLGNLRHILKALVYEVVLGFGFGTLIVYLFTHSWRISLVSVIVYTIIKIIVYFFYDKLWVRYVK